ncbi:MAG: MaoC family dehydratase N-terminal domain-containing protein [Acidimicrobiales bacterium]
MTESSKEWSPPREDREDTVSIVSASALHGLFDLPGPAPEFDDPLPPLWHWLAFLPTAPQRDLGTDGHPRTGSFLPRSPLPRRMFAGARFEYLASVAVGEIMHRRSEVTAVTKKEGRSGDLLFVEVTHLLYTGNRLAIREIQNLVYRNAEQSGTTSASSNGIVERDWEWRKDFSTDPAMLFRFCALTYNAHRIHYDRTYATETEGYPGLVVPGPLLAIALSRLGADQIGDQPLRTFEFRATNAIFDGDLVQLRGRRSGEDSIELAAFDGSARLSMTATATAEKW